MSTQDQLNAEIDTQLPDNNSNQVAPATLRGVLHDMVGYTADQAIGFSVSSYGAVGGGITNDTTSIQAALNAANTAGGGVVTFQTESYLISGTMTIGENVSVNGNGATLLLGINGESYIDGLTTYLSPTVTQDITVNPTAGTNTITVASGAAFSVGQRVGIKAGNDVTDPTTPAVAFTAVITNIAGNVLTLDRFFTYPVAPVGSSWHTVQLFSQYQHDFYVRDLCLEVTGSAGVSHGMDLTFSYNVEFDNIVGNKLGGTNMGFGLIGAFWSENITVRHCTLYHNRNTEASSSHGRMFNFAGCRNVYIYDAEAQDIHNNFAFIEGHSQNVNFYNSSIRHYNNLGGFTVFSVDLSQVYAENTYVEMPNTYDFVGFGGVADPFTQANFRNITLRGILPRVMPGFNQVSGIVDWNNGTNYFIVDIDSAYTSQRTIPLTTDNTTYFLDYGLLLDLEIYTSPDTNVADIANVFLGTRGTDGSNNNNGINIQSSLIAGSWVSISPNGGAGIFGTGGNIYGGFTGITNRTKLLVQFTGSNARGYISVRTRVAPFIAHNNPATPITPYTDNESDFFGKAFGAPKLQSGVHTVTAGEAAATTATFLTGLDTVTTINVQILRAGVNVTSTAVISSASGQLTVSNGAGYTLTNGDKINWMVVA